MFQSKMSSAREIKFFFLNKFLIFGLEHLEHWNNIKIEFYTIINYIFDYNESIFNSRKFGRY